MRSQQTLRHEAMHVTVRRGLRRLADDGLAELNSGATNFKTDGIQDRTFGRLTSPRSVSQDGARGAKLCPLRQEELTLPQQASVVSLVPLLRHPADRLNFAWMDDGMFGWMAMRDFAYRSGFANRRGAQLEWHDAGRHATQ